MLPYVYSFEDVRGDGNCGFRVIASLIYEDENKWRWVRQSVYNEIYSNQDLYHSIYTDLEVVMARIQ